MKPDEQNLAAGRGRPLDYGTADKRDAFKAVLRWGLTLSSLAMLAFAGLTFFAVLPFPQWTALIFVAVAAMDLAVAFVVFGSKSNR